MTIPRSHSISTCDATDYLYHLGGRYFLSTKHQTVQLSTQTLKMSPLSVYHIPCNQTSEELPIGFGTCPDQLTINLPIFRKKTVKYVPWTPSDLNNNTINLHYKSLQIPPPLQFNKTVINALDKTFNRLDGDLATKLKSIREDIKNLHEESSTPLALVIASMALCFSHLNLIIFIVLCCYHRRRGQAQPDLSLVHYVKVQPRDKPASPPNDEFTHITQSCPDCGEDELSLTASPNDPNLNDA